MKILSVLDQGTRRLCVRLGRYGKWSRFLDSIGRLVCPAFVDPLLLPAAVGTFSPLIYMRPPAVTSNQGGAHDLSFGPPPSPVANGGDPGDPPHSTAECSKLIYHGMHGAPCAFHGGSPDNKWCPPGTISGLWWRFNIPGLGNIYYVDCCGLPIAWKVWCRWSKEQNWCAGRGGNTYTCTLTLTYAELKIDASGFADPLKHVLAGPPSP